MKKNGKETEEFGFTYLFVFFGCDESENVIKYIML